MKDFHPECRLVIYPLISFVILWFIVQVSFTFFTVVLSFWCLQLYDFAPHVDFISEVCSETGLNFTYLEVASPHRIPWFCWLPQCPEVPYCRFRCWCNYIFYFFLISLLFAVHICIIYVYRPKMYFGGMLLKYMLNPLNDGQRFAGSALNVRQFHLLCIFMEKDIFNRCRTRAALKRFLICKNVDSESSFSSFNV